MKAPREAEGPPGEPAGAGTAGLAAAPGAIWLCGDVQASRPLELELAAILPHTEVWFIHGNHDTEFEAHGVGLRGITALDGRVIRAGELDSPRTTDSSHDPR